MNKNKKKLIRINTEDKIRKKIICRLERNLFYSMNLSSREIGMAIKTRKRCSCPMCGNQRKHYNKKTRKEIIIDLEFKQVMKEL